MEQPQGQAPKFALTPSGRPPPDESPLKEARLNDVRPQKKGQDQRQNSRNNNLGSRSRHDIPCWDVTTLSVSMGSSPWRGREVAEVAALSSKIHSTNKHELNQILEEDRRTIHLC